MSLSSILSTEIALLDDSDEEQEKDEDMLLACVLVENISQRKKKANFYVINRMEWESHIAELIG